MVDFGGFGGQAVGWLQTWIFWGLILFGLAAGAIGGLYLRKKKKLRYPACELVPLGSGTYGIQISKAGYFRKKRTLFGLLDYGGEESLLLQDGRKIFNASSEDFWEINGVRGPVVVRKGDDPEILAQVVFGEIDEQSQKLLMQIAPGDYRDAAEELIGSAERETMKKWEKILPYVAIGIIVLFALIVIIVAVQFANGSMDKADKILQRAEAINARTPEIIGKEVGDAIAEALNEGATPEPSTQAP